MTVLSLPARPQIRGQRFRLVTPTARNPSRNAWNMGVIMGEPYFACELETTELSKALAGEFKWLDAEAQGRLATVYLYDAERQRPLHGAIGSGVTITSVSRANRTLTLAGLPANRVIAAGDYLHWDDGPARRLHILGPAQANGSGVVTVRCEPPPPATVTASLPAPATFERASAEFVILGMDVRYEAPITSSVTLQATSIIRRF